MYVEDLLQLILQQSGSLRNVTDVGGDVRHAARFDVLRQAA